jgi:hypothetical protein
MDRGIYLILFPYMEIVDFRNQQAVFTTTSPLESCDCLTRDLVLQLHC